MQMGCTAAVLLVGVATTGSLVPAAQSAQQARVLAPPQRGCAQGHWAATAERRPAALGGGSGYFVWQDALGWHIRARGADGERFQAKVAADAPLRVSLASATVRKMIRLRGRGFSFDVAGTTRAVGLDFRTPCASRLSFRFGAELPPLSRAPSALQQPVYLGSKDNAPGAAFVLERPGKTGVAGRILVGPTCPVVGTADDCPPAKPAAGTIRIQTAATDRARGSGGKLVKTIVSDARGNFATQLSPGEYVLLVVVKDNTDLGNPTPRPTYAIVEAGVVTQVTLVLDTGIR
jgi:hypothetical protein